MPRNVSWPYFSKVWHYMQLMCKTGRCPAAVVVCGTRCYKAAAKSGDILDIENRCRNPRLEEAYARFKRESGNKVSRPNGKVDKEWACAERAAANEVLNASCNLPRIADLNFSDAYRPRTRRIVPYCRTCEGVFNL